MIAVSTLIAVLGMHRSGTSAVVGSLQQYGIALGPVSESNRFNARGNRELPKLNELHDRILERGGGSWWRPPAQVVVEPVDRRERDDVLAEISGEQIAVKDPRMLLVLDLWRELEPRWIGVIRNPIAVRRSLERRAQEQGNPSLDADSWEALWCHYNRRLLEELKRSPFPMIDFDRADQLDAQLRAAVYFYGIEPREESDFFDPGLVNENGGDEWRSRVAPETLELWERLSARTPARI